jgi:hypothetical protein
MVPGYFTNYVFHLETSTADRDTRHNSEIDDDGDDELRRPGALSHAQLEILQAKAEEIRNWITETAKAFHVSRATISVNMGLDRRERRATSFWNKFQTVHYARLAESLALKQTENGDEAMELHVPSKTFDL